MNPFMMASFRDELTKIAFGGAVGNAIKDSWTSDSTFGKTLNVAGTALALPGVLRKEDATGQGRSRIERGSELVGGTLGGMAGNTFATKATNALTKNMTGKWGKGALGMGLTLAGGIAGSVGGSKLLSAPMAHFRKARQARQEFAQQHAQQPQHQQVQHPHPMHDQVST